MRIFLAPILLLTLLFPSLAYGVSMADLVVRDGLHYKKFSDVPFTGKVTGKSQGSFKDGKKHGPWFHYWDNGQLKSKGIYRDGKEEGLWVRYWGNGEVAHKEHFKNRKQTLAGDQLWLFRRDFIYFASGIKIPNREILILSKDGKYYSGSVGGDGFGHDFRDRINVICPKNMIPSSLPGDENLFSKNSYINVFLEGNFYQKDAGTILSEPKYLGYNIPETPWASYNELPKPSLCTKNIYELKESKLESIYSSSPKKSGNRADKMSLFYRDAIFHIPSIMVKTPTLLLKKKGGFLDGGFFPTLPKQYIQSMSYLDNGGVRDLPSLPPIRLQFKGPFSMKSAYQAHFLLAILEERQLFWGCLVDAIDQHNKAPRLRKKPSRLEKLISALGDFYDLGIGAPDIEFLNTYYIIFRNSSAQEIAESSQKIIGSLLLGSSAMPSFDEVTRRKIQLLRNNKNLRSLYPEYLFSEIYLNDTDVSVNKLKELEFQYFNRLIRTQEYKNFKIALDEFFKLSPWDFKELLKELVFTAPKSSCGVDDMYMYFDTEKFEIEKSKTINSLMIEDSLND